MSDSTPIQPLLALLDDLEGDWTKAVFTHPPADGAKWEKLTAEPVSLAAGRAAKVVTTGGGRVTTTTVEAGGWKDRIHDILQAGPAHINVLSAAGDWHARRAKSGRWLVSRGKPSRERALAAAHDRAAKHPLSADDPNVRVLFIEIGLISHSGQLRGEAAAKHRQVQHYLELLRPLRVLKQAPGSRLRIVDAGCGKAYLSLSLYLFARQLGLEPELIGVDRAGGVLADVERSARRLGYEQVGTVASSIEEFAATGADCDLLISLHACDTATDEAIAAGVRLGAGAIVVAPCCHHETVVQIDEQITLGRDLAAWEAVTRSGLLRHRLADVITDGLRGEALEAFGYRADMLEFVSPEATARNLMIRAERRAAGSGLEAAKAAGLRRFDALAATWGLNPAVRRMLADRWPADG
ncbi:MAG: SAM-dependent methyltransferase [Dehalococcoidia bacterium]|nr:SAM-dependent methyltransferase [Dehalococcoidia bacterium]